jgi:maltose O-acetyltransferase
MTSEKERMLLGEPYLSTDPGLLAERRECRLRCEKFNATSFADADAGEAILRELLGAVGPETVVLAPFQCDYGYQITIGARTHINYGAVLLDAAEVTIGDDVQIGPGVQLITALHPLDAAARRTGEETAAPVRVQDDVWLAAGVLVLPGVTIGAATVVGAGSVVTRDLPPRHLCFGNPCRVIRPI